MYDRLMGRIKNLETMFDDMSKKVAELVTWRKDLNDKKGKGDEEYKKLSEDISSMEKISKDLTKSLESLKRELKSFSDKVSTLEKEVLDLKKLVSDSSGRNKTSSKNNSKN